VSKIDDQIEKIGEKFFLDGKVLVGSGHA